MAKVIPSITVPNFRTAETLIQEFKTAEKSTNPPSDKAKKALHDDQSSFFKGLFDGIWKSLADNFKTIVQLNVKGSAIEINDVKYNTSSKQKDGNRFIHLTRANEDTKMPKLLNLKTTIASTDSNLEDSKPQVQYLQIQDTQDDKSHKTTYWIDENVILSSDSAAKRYRLADDKNDTSKKSKASSNEDITEAPIRISRKRRERDQALGLEFVDTSQLEHLSTNNRIEWNHSSSEQ